MQCIGKQADRQVNNNNKKNNNNNKIIIKKNNIFCAEQTVKSQER